MKTVSRIVVITIGAIVATYLVLALSLTQGVALSHHKDSPINKVELAESSLDNRQPDLLSSLFIYTDIISSKGTLYIQVDNSEGKLQAIPLKNMFSEMLLFSNHWLKESLPNSEISLYETGAFITCLVSL